MKDGFGESWSHEALGYETMKKAAPRPPFTFYTLTETNPVMERLG